VKKAMLTASLCALALSCVSTGTTVLNPAARRPPVTPEKVVIYMSADKVQGKYEELAILSSQGAYTVAHDEVFYESFRKEAAKVGANGVILSAIEDPTTGQKVGSAILGAFLIPTTMANRKTQATAIYVFPVPPTAQEVAAAQALNATRAERIAALDAVVHPGMTREAMVDVVGSPTKATIEIDGSGSRETAIYTSNTGASFLVILKKNVVASVTRQ
jgi:hypothetical protein